MASGESAPNEPLDERLAKARDSVLMQTERIVAQEAGDAGQAIVLTDSRVILLKVGITATGELNGQKTGAYALSQVTAVNVRKGPVGAVIQVVSGSREPTSQGGPPDNVIVFTGPQKVKKCELIAAQIEAVTGKPIERVDAKRESKAQRPAQPEAVTETHVDTEPLGTGAMLRDETPSTKHSPVVELQVEEETEEEEEERIELRPNPNLPKPIRARSGGLSRALVLLGVLAAVVLVGLGVIGPLRQTSEPLPEMSRPDLSKDIFAIKQQLATIEDYREKASPVVSKAETLAAKIEAGLRSGNRAALASALSNGTIDDLCSSFSKLQAPGGLAGSKESIVNGLFGLRTVAAGIGAGMQSQGDLDVPGRLARIAQARSSLRSGLKAVDARIDTLKSRLAELRGSE